MFKLSFCLKLFTEFIDEHWSVPKFFQDHTMSNESAGSAKNLRKKRKRVKIKNSKRQIFASLHKPLVFNPVDL